jgi:endonuclease IV
MERVSYHTSVKRIKDRGVYQIFLGSPRRYEYPNASDLEGIDKDIVVHCPYWTQLAREAYEKAYISTLDYTVKLAHEMQKVGQKYIVIHVGARPSDMTIARGMDCIKGFCERWLFATMDTDVILCLENDSGSKKGTKMGSVKVLETVINDINSTRVRMAFDTEHAYANGFDLSNTDRLKQIEPLVAVVHFNSIPDYVGRGSHVDRHTSTKFSESKNGIKYLHNVYRELYDGVRPFIMEIDENLAEENLEFLKQFLDGEGSYIDAEWTEIK